MGALADFHPAAVGRGGQPLKKGTRHFDRAVTIPFRVHDQHRDGNAGGIVERFAGGPVFAPILDGSVGRHQLRRTRPCLTARERRIGPGFEPRLRQQFRFLVVGNAVEPARSGGRAFDDTVGADGAAGVGEARCFPDPLRRQQDELVDTSIVVGGVTRHLGGAPRPADQVELPDATSRPDEGNRRRDVADRDLGADDRRVVRRRHRHLRRPCRVAVAPDVDEVDVITAAGEMIHPRHPRQRKIEGSRRRIGRSGDEQDRLFGRELREVGPALVADEQLDPGRVARDHDFFGDNMRPGGFVHVDFPVRAPHLPRDRDCASPG